MLALQFPTISNQKEPKDWWLKNVILAVSTEHSPQSSDSRIILPLDVKSCCLYWQGVDLSAKLPGPSHHAEGTIASPHP